ncbi:MAG: hypothetical protein JW797_20170 [Bradymonadales bacterium]|nr:hypothetical protein [Bradymonadales bacterium]
MRAFLSSPTSPFFAALLATALLLAVAPAHAESDQHPPGWFLPVGIDVGLSLDGDDTGALLGAEASAVFLEGSWWYGLVADGLYDFRSDAFRIGLGPELGWFILGVETSAVLQLDSNEAIWGTRVRGMISGAVLVLYGGWVHLFGGEEEDIGELGLLFKWPFKL